jgi:hypothetical protein
MTPVKHACHRYPRRRRGRWKEKCLIGFIDTGWAPKLANTVPYVNIAIFENIWNLRDVYCNPAVPICNCWKGVCLYVVIYGAICLQSQKVFLQPVHFQQRSKISILLYVVSKPIQKNSRLYGKIARYYVLIGLTFIQAADDSERGNLNRQSSNLIWLHPGIAHQVELYSNGTVVLYGRKLL